MIDDRKRKQQMNALFKECQRRKNDDKCHLEYEVIRKDGTAHMKCRSRAQAIGLAKAIDGTYRKIG